MGELSAEFNDRLGLSLTYSIHDALKNKAIELSRSDGAILHTLACELASYAARDEETEKAVLWRAHNDLEPTRPLVFCDPEHGWHEIILPKDMRCEGPFARVIEFLLRKEIFRATRLQDDKVIEPFIRIPRYFTETERGARETRVGGEKSGDAYAWTAAIHSYDAIDDLQYKRFIIDGERTEHAREVLVDCFGDVLGVCVIGAFWWSLCPTHDLINLRGLGQLLLDFYDNPDGVHKAMAFLRDETNAFLDDLEQKGLLCLNNDGTYVGSGGFGFTDELPSPTYDRKNVRTTDLWGFAESQETSSISPEMFNEFVLPYQIEVLSRFGLNCYGCCEPLDTRWKYVKRIPRLRRISISHWADFEKCAEFLGKNYVFSWKPFPGDLAKRQVDDGMLRAKIRKAVGIAEKYGCHLEIIMKDCHTLGNNPENAVIFTRIAKEEGNGCS